MNRRRPGEDDSVSKAHCLSDEPIGRSLFGAAQVASVDEVDWKSFLHENPMKMTHPWVTIPVPWMVRA